MAAVPQAQPLEGCCVHVWQRVDGDVAAINAISAKLKALGAKTAQRLSKEVTHVIFQRKLQSTSQERSAEDADLRQIYSKCGKAEPPVYVVSPLWLQHCEDTRVRAKEVRYLERRPADPIFLVASPNKTASAKDKRKRKSVVARPRELVQTADLDDAIFSSSQQIRELNDNEDDGPGAGAAGKPSSGALGRQGFGGPLGSSLLGSKAGPGRMAGMGRRNAMSDVEDAGEEPRAKAPSLTLAALLGPRKMPIAGPSGAGVARGGSASAAAGGASRAAAPSRPAQAQAPGRMRQLPLSFTALPRPSGPRAQPTPADQPLQPLNAAPQPAAASAGPSEPAVPGSTAATGVDAPPQGIAAVFAAPKPPGPAPALGAAAAAAMSHPASMPRPRTAPSPGRGAGQPSGAAAAAHPTSRPGTAAAGTRATEEADPVEDDDGDQDDDVVLMEGPVMTAGKQKRRSVGGCSSRPASAVKRRPPLPSPLGHAPTPRGQGAAKHEGEQEKQTAERRGRTPKAARGQGDGEQEVAASSAADAPSTRAAPSPRYPPLSCLASAGKGATAAAGSTAPTADLAGPSVAPTAAGDAAANVAARSLAPSRQASPCLPPRGPSSERQRRVSTAQEPPQGAAATLAGAAAALAAAAAAGPPPSTAPAGAGAGPGPSGRRGSRSLSGTPLGMPLGRGRELGVLTPGGTPLALGLTPATLTVPRLKSQTGVGSGPGSGGAAAAAPPNPSASCTPEPGVPAAANTAGWTAAGTSTVADAPGDGPHADVAGRIAGRTGPEAQLDLAAALTQPSARRASGRRTGLPPTPKLGAGSGWAGMVTPRLDASAVEAAAAAAAGPAAEAAHPPPAAGREEGAHAEVGVDNGAAATAPTTAAGRGSQRKGRRAAATPLLLSPVPLPEGGVTTFGRRVAGREDADAAGPSGSPPAPAGADPGPGPSSAAAPAVAEGTCHAAGGQTPGSVLRRSSRLATASPLPLGRSASALHGTADAPGPPLLWGGFKPLPQPQPSPAPVPGILQPASQLPSTAPVPVEEAAERATGRLGTGATPGTARKGRRRQQQAAPEDQEEQPGPGPGPTAQAADAAPEPPSATPPRRQHPGAAAAAEEGGTVSKRLRSAAKRAATAAAAAPQPAAAGAASQPRPQPQPQPQPTDAGPQPPGALPAGVPESPPRSAIAPSASKVAGTPLTSPNYRTRFQRRRFGRLGLDLEQLDVPPGRPFVLQPDGVVQPVGEEDAGEQLPNGGEAESRGAQGATAAEAKGAAGAAEASAATPSPAMRPGSVTRSRRRALQFDQADEAGLSSAQAATASAATAAGVPGPGLEQDGRVLGDLAPGTGPGTSEAGAAGASQPPAGPSTSAAGAGSLFARLRGKKLATAADATLALAPPPSPAAVALAAATGLPPRPLAAVAEDDEAGAEASGSREGTPVGSKPVPASNPAEAKPTTAGRRGKADGASAPARRSTPRGRPPAPQPHESGGPAAANAGAAAAANGLKREGRLSLRKQPLAAPATTGVNAASRPAASAGSQQPLGLPPAVPKPAAPTGTRTRSCGSAAATAAAAASAPCSPRAGSKRSRASAATPSTAPAQAVDRATGDCAAAATPTAKRRRTGTGAGAGAGAGALAPALPAVAEEAPSATAAAMRSAPGLGPSRKAKPAASEDRSTAPATKRLRSGAKPSSKTTPAADAAATAIAQPGPLVAQSATLVPLGASTVMPLGRNAAAASAWLAASGAGAAPLTVPVAPALGQYPRGRQHPLRAGVRYLAHTCIDAASQAAIAAAVKQLGGARLCTPGYEDGHVTHMVLPAAAAEQRRTLKALLGIANGALFVSPAWVADSLAAGRWLPEEPYHAQGAFAATADAVRQQLHLQHQSDAAADPSGAAAPPAAAPAPAQPHAQPRAPGSPRAGMAAKPLAGRLVAVHNAQCNGPKLAEAQARKADVEKLVVALGGRVVPARSATVLLLVGGGLGTTSSQTGGGASRRARPAGVCAGSVPVAAEEWLMRLAETHVWEEPGAGAG